MADAIRNKIYKMLDSIKDERTLAQVMEDVAFYSSKKDSVETLNDAQLKELEAAMTEADNDQVISWSNFRNELGEWKDK